MMRFVDEQVWDLIRKALLDVCRRLPCHAAGGDDYLRALNQLVDFICCSWNVFEAANHRQLSGILEQRPSRNL
jgi:NADH:ubiquinone oxidoreductase subunit E